MMMTVLLLAFAAVCVSAAPTGNNEKHWLMLTVLDELNASMNAMKDLANQDMSDVFLNDLKVKGELHCTNDFFCQAEEELKKVSGLSGAKFEPFRTDMVLIRNLNKFNEHYRKSCKTADGKDEISLPDFLRDLKRCVQKGFSTSMK